MEKFTSTVTIPLKEYMDLKDKEMLLLKNNERIEEVVDNINGKFLVTSNLTKVDGINLSFNRFKFPQGGIIKIVRLK